MLVSLRPPVEMIGSDLDAACFCRLSFSQIMSFSRRGRGARPEPTGQRSGSTAARLTPRDDGAGCRGAGAIPGRAGEDGTALDEDDAAVGERVDRRVLLVDDDDDNASLAD